MINMKVSKLLKMRKMYLTKNKIKKENNMLFIDIVAMIELLRKTMNTIDDHITNIDDAKINIIINEDKPINELTLSDIKRLSVYILIIRKINIVIYQIYILVEGKIK